MFAWYVVKVGGVQSHSSLLLYRDVSPRPVAIEDSPPAACVEISLASTSF